MINCSLILRFIVHNVKGAHDDGTFVQAWPSYYCDNVMVTFWVVKTLEYFFQSPSSYKSDAIFTKSMCVIITTFSKAKDKYFGTKLIFSKFCINVL